MKRILLASQRLRAFRAACPGTAVALEVVTFVLCAGSIVAWPQVWDGSAVLRLVAVLIPAALAVISIATIPKPED
jgi:hypothetical protein